MLASLARGAEFADIVRGFVDRATQPLLARIAELEDARDATPDIDAISERIAEAVRVAVDALPAPPEGRQGPAGERGEPGQDGAAASEEAIAAAVAAYLEANPPAAGERGPPGEAGRDGANGADGVGLAGAIIDREGNLHLTLTDGTTRELGQVVGADGRDGIDGAAGRDGVDGTDGAPGERGEPGEPGERGADGKGFEVRGTYEPEGSYSAGDIVMLNGASFVALADEPGECPGPAWQLWARQGKPGQKGDRGERGERGEKGASAEVARLVGGRIDPERMELVLALDDGETLAVDLMPMAEIIRAMP